MEPSWRKGPDAFALVVGPVTVKWTHEGKRIYVKVSSEDRALAGMETWEPIEASSVPEPIAFDAGPFVDLASITLVPITSIV